MRAAAPIVLDGNFGDWAGQACVSDSYYDSADWGSDILNFCFANNENDSTAYFMLERQVSLSTLDLELYVDANNNGVYGDYGDRVISIRYTPLILNGYVTVRIYTGTGQYLSTITSGATWGEGILAGGNRVEWMVPFDDLGIYPGQPIRMYASSIRDSSISDSTAEIQWSPANALGIVLLAGILVSGSAWFGYRRSKAGV